MTLFSMFFLRGKEGSARLGRFLFPREFVVASIRRYVENINYIKDINREDKSKARMRVPAKRIVVWITTKVIIIVIKSKRVTRYCSVKKMRELIGKKHKE